MTHIPVKGEHRACYKVYGYLSVYVRDMFEFMDTSQKCTRTLLELKDVVEGLHEDHGYQSEYFTSLMMCIYMRHVK